MNLAQRSPMPIPMSGDKINISAIKDARVPAVKTSPLIIRRKKKNRIMAEPSLRSDSPEITMVSLVEQPVDFIKATTDTGSVAHKILPNSMQYIHPH